MPSSQRMHSPFDFWFRRVRLKASAHPGRPISITAAALATHSVVGYALAPMLCARFDADFKVSEGGYVALQDVQGCRVTCCSGRLWITEEGKFNDGSLVTGQALQVTRPGKTLILALRDSRFNLQ